MRVSSMLRTAAVAGLLGLFSLAQSAPPTVAGTLKSHLNTANATVGEPVAVVTTANLKENGRVVIPKGSTLVGTVTSAAAAPNKTAPAQLEILFNRATTPKGQSVAIKGGISFLTASNGGMTGLPSELSYSPDQASGGYVLSARGNFHLDSGLNAQVAITSAPGI